jgi:hypothetical protein
MSLTAGSRLGVYDIVAPLGVGAPPSLNTRFARSYGGSTGAKETTR